MAHACRPATKEADEALRAAEAETLALCAELAPWGIAAVEHAHASVAKEHSALWNFIYGAFMASFNGGDAKDPTWRGAGTASLYECVVACCKDKTPASFIFHIDRVFAHLARTCAPLPCSARYPEETVRWSTDNTKRADLVPDMNLLPAKNQSVTALRRSESSALQWCDDPFAFSSEGGGLSEENPVIFLIAYWIGRFHGFVSGEA